MNHKNATSKNPIEDARKNNLELLYNIMDCDAKTNNAYIAYKWLWVARDFNCTKIDNLIEDVEEISSLKYDDDGYKKANVHCELAIAYLNGGEGLPVDLHLSEEHLKRASEYIDLKDFVTDIISDFNGEVKRTLENYLRPNLASKLIELIKTVNILKEVNAPKVILEEEERKLEIMFKKFKNQV